MKRSSVLIVASILLGVLSGRTALTADAIIGVNIRGYGTASDRQQDDLIEQLHKSGVTTIRESLPNNVDERFTRFVTRAYKAGIGIVIGLCMALALTRLVGDLLFGVSPNDPGTFLTVALTLTLTALLAAAIPAMRAARIDPTRALRQE